MDENYDETFGIRISIKEDIYPNTEKKIDNENNNDEQRNVNTHVNNGHNVQPIINNNTNNYNNNLNNNNYNYNENFYYNNNNIIIHDYNDKQINMYNNFYQNIYIQNDLNKYNIKNNETCINVGEGEAVQVNSQKYTENNENKKTSNTSNNTVNFNGKQINTSNEAVDEALINMFNTKEINLDSKKDMQLLKKKQKRRTKIEVDKEKKLKLNEIKKQKKKGRKRKGIGLTINSNVHTKYSDDNIIKKINSFFLESTRNWLNNSFIDEKGNFQTPKIRKKLKKSLFLKISPKLITTNLKRETVILILNAKFKDIFFNHLSIKYKKDKENQNIKLIEEIYNQKNQPFVIYILELTFFEVFSLFNGQDKGEEIRKYFSKNYNISQNIIDKFLNNFNKIDIFLNEIKKKEERQKQTEEMIQEYVQRISLLCLNYKEWFINKYNRTENKNKKGNEEGKDIYFQRPTTLRFV